MQKVVELIQILLIKNHIGVQDEGQKLIDLVIGGIDDGVDALAEKIDSGKRFLCLAARCVHHPQPLHDIIVDPLLQQLPQRFRLLIQRCKAQQPVGRRLRGKPCALHAMRSAENMIRRLAIGLCKRFKLRIDPPLAVGRNAQNTECDNRDDQHPYPVVFHARSCF